MVSACNWTVLVIMVCLAHFAQPLKLPTYITPCKADANLDACSIKNGNAAIQRFINGDPKYKIPKLDPFKITRLIINQGTKQVGLNITLTNTKVTGLSKAKLVGSRTDLKKKHVEWDLNIPRIMLLGGYSAAGKVLVLPITGRGKGNVTLMNVKVTYKFDFALERKKGEEYLKVVKSRLNFDTSRMYIRLDNLFNGDRALGNAMNTFLDENWREVVTQFGPGVGDAIAAVFTQILVGLAAEVPFKNLFIK